MVKKVYFIKEQNLVKDQKNYSKFNLMLFVNGKIINFTWFS